MSFALQFIAMGIPVRCLVLEGKKSVSSALHKS
jgi:hypothetical protein